MNRKNKKRMDPDKLALIKLIFSILSIVAFVVFFILGYLYG